MTLSERIERAHKVVRKMCEGHRGPRMSIPAHRDDEDVLLAGVLDDTSRLLWYMRQSGFSICYQKGAETWAVFDNGLNGTYLGEWPDLPEAIRYAQELAG